MLKKEGIPDNVLNARYNDIEAEIIADAGKTGSVKIAIYMAGYGGTDIKLRGNLEMWFARELQGVEEPELRKQIQEKAEKEMLRRSGWLVDPGASKFFLSLEDDLMRIFSGETLEAMLQKLGIEEEEAITHPWANNAQMWVEGRNYDIRKQLLKYDDVMNEQKKVIYARRYDLMSETTDFSDDVSDMSHEVIANIKYNNVPENTPSDFWNYQVINNNLVVYFGPNIELTKNENMPLDNAVEIISENAAEKMKKKKKYIHMKWCDIWKEQFFKYW